eukprot:TRINITY_DN24022_c0_g3_i1.p1 TRINITY_DN24022_c0_g3~~TRINITY_DN24022_c0_g3_i1.p1  ORF type:complete len:2478 (-),score=472.10 TRINITY_DN24022_c0_g3_i1:96-7529(-)
MAGMGASPGLGQQLAMLQQVSQMQKSFQDVIGTNNNDVEASPEDQKRLEEEKAREQAVEAASTTTKYRFRLCVYSGQDLPRDNSYILVKVTNYDGTEREHRSQISSVSSHPVWEFFMEEDIFIHSVQGPPRVELTLWGHRILTDKFDSYLGSTVLKLPNLTTNGPVKQQLRMAPSSLTAMKDRLTLSCKEASTPTIHVVWQVCSETQLLPDLIRIAEKDDEASDKANYQFGARLLSATLRRPTEGSRRLGVSFKLITPDGEVSKSCPVQSTPLVSTQQELKSQGGSSDAPSDDQQSCNQAIWKEDGTQTLGWVMPTWALRESEIALMSYMVEAHLFMYPAPSPNAPAAKKKGFQLTIRGYQNDQSEDAEDRPTRIGVWRETLGDILEGIDASGHGLICEAQMESKEGQTVAHLRLELDIFKGQPNRMPVSMVCRMPAELPDRPAPKMRGVPPKEIWHNKVQYYCSIMVDGLPTLEQAHEQTFPYVRITMGSNVYTTDVKDTHSVNYVNFDKPLVITTTVINRKAKIEIMAKQFAGGIFGEDKVLGEANVFDITCDKDQEQEYTLHCFGGAIRAPNPDEAQQMVKGALRPASTYTGTVFVKFGNKMTTKDYFETIKKQLTRSRLVVRLYSGLNLGGFAGKKVTIICRVPGCRLPDQQGAKKLLQLQQEFQDMKEDKTPGKSVSHSAKLAKRKEVQEGPLRGGDGISFNNNILAFPGEVDDKGRLHFLDEKGMTGKRLKWVERSTPKAWPLWAPQKVSHVMLYVVVEGEESGPPTVFGRLRLSKTNPLNDPSKPPLDEVAPKWKRMRYDTSVVTLPIACYKSDFAGFILGSATMVKLGSEEVETVDGIPVLSPRGVTFDREPDGCCSSGTGTKKDLLPPDYSRNMCCGTTSLIQASLGEPEDTKCMYVAQETLKTVYCHLDVLAARELPSMDSDGLVDPAYSIDVLDQSLLYPEGTMKSLSPSFMHRVCIPITLEVEPGRDPNFPLMASTIPFPPIVFKMLDRDDRKTMGFTTGEEFEEVGTVVIKHAGIRCASTQKWIFPLLGYDEEKVVPGPTGAKFAQSKMDSVDVNSAHVAMWHALDKPAKAPFDNSEIGVDASWAKRPRVLIAANYSLQEKLAPRCLGERLPKAKHSGDGSATIHMLATQETASFQIECALLGLRNLPDSLVDAKFYVSSFWEGAPMELAIGSNASGPMQRNHNFMADEGENESWKQFADGVKSLVRFQDDDNNDVQDATVPVVNLNDVCGIKIKAPIYRVPVLPYLQQDIIKSGRWVFKGGGNEMILEIHHEYGSSIFQVGKVDTLAHAETVNKKVSGYLDIKNHKVKFVLEEKDWNGTLSNQGKSLRLTSGELTFDGTWQEDDPWVLLPALTFQLKNCVTGADYGVLTVGMNAYRQPKQPPSSGMKRTQSGTLVEDDGSWLQLCIREFNALPRELREWTAPARPNDPKNTTRTGTIQALKGLRTTEDAYECFVDVYASGAGWMQFDENNFIGKVLTDHCLFSIFKSSDEEDDKWTQAETFTQFLNPCDYMAGDSRFNNDDFDEDVWPQFCCGPGWKEDPRLGQLDNGSSVLEENLEKSIAWLTTKQSMIDWEVSESRKRPQHPAGPKDLYSAFFKAMNQTFTTTIPKVVPRNVDELKRKTTKELSHALKAVGWRNVSHLSAPEPARGPDTRASGPDLSVNRHTFMRPVGHRIGVDRDSRFLCRLRMDMPKAFIASQRKQLQEFLQVLKEPPREGDEGRAARQQQARAHANKIIESLSRIDMCNSNYLVIKFREPGLVIWAAPEHQTVWDRPGTLLFAVRLLKNQDVVVPVTVPNMDLRRPKETAWYTVKNLTTRFRHLEEKVERRRKRQERGKRQRSTSRKSPASHEAEDVEKGEEDTEKDSEEDTEPNGFSRRVPVSTDAFVCRLKRRFGGKQYDRIQGNDWYRMVLREAFPEIDTLPDHVDTKTFFMSKFLNLRSALALPSDQGETILKGHVQCTRVLEQGASNKSNMGEIEPPLAAIENLWTSSGVHVNLYLLTFTKLEFTDTADSSELYFLALHGNTTERVDVTSTGKKDVDVYETLQFETQLPGAGIVRIQAWAKGALAFSDVMIGEMQLDLEDRWLCLKRKELRCQTNQDFLKANVSPKAYSRYYMVNPPDERLWEEPQVPEIAEEGKGCEIRPARAPGDRMPIESRFMLLQDQGGGHSSDRSRSGMLRYCLDMCPSTVQAPDIPPKVTTAEFEVRVCVISVDNIKVYKDFGQRNDLFVELKYKAQSMDGSEVNRKEKTQVHRWAHQDASFNERFIFPLTGPCTSAHVEFTLFDQDRVTSADLVYHPQVYSLDHLAQLAYSNWKERREPITQLYEDVTFDSWPSKNILSAQSGFRCCRCLRRSSKAAYLTNAVKKAFYAKLHLSVEVVPKSYVDSMPPAPAGVFEPPKDRLSWQMLATNPVKTMKVMLGPRLYGLLRTTVLVVVFLLGLLLCLTVIYYIVMLATNTASFHNQINGS